jgi:hypothetical protein
MKIEFHINQINEMMKYLDELPHKYARKLIEYIDNHVKTQLPQSEKTEITNENQESAIDGITVNLVHTDEQKS